MIWVWIRMIKRNPVFTRNSFIDEYSSSEYSSSYRCCIDAISWLLMSEELASHTDTRGFFTVMHRSILIYPEKVIKWASSRYLYSAKFYILEDSASMCPSRCCPLVPVVRSIENRECWARRMNICLGKPSRHPPPSSWLLDSPHGSPPDDPMWYSGCFEIYDPDLGIIFLDRHTPPPRESLPCCPELISLPYSLYDIVAILAIILIEKSTPSTVVTKIEWDEGTMEGLHGDLFGR